MINLCLVSKYDEFSIILKIKSQVNAFDEHVLGAFFKSTRQKCRPRSECDHVC